MTRLLLTGWLLLLSGLTYAAATVSQIRVAEGRTSNTRLLKQATQVAFRVYVMPGKACPACVTLEYYLQQGGYQLKRVKATADQCAKIAAFPTVAYSNGWFDNGQCIYHHQCNIAPTVEIVECAP